MSPNNIKTKEKRESVFDQFTNKYSLQKTLRFELRPTPETRAMLEANGVIQTDQKRKENYQATKPFFDRIHQEFITDSLTDVTLQSLNGYESVYKEWQSNKKDKALSKKIEAKEKEIRKELVSLFDAKATDWINSFDTKKEIKKANHQFLFEPVVFEILEQKYGDEPEAKNSDGQSIFVSWDRWTAYFGKFFETRKNFYKDDGTATAVATRIVNGNLRRFCDNKIDFLKLKNKLDLSELETYLGQSISKFFEIKSYNQYLSQVGIDKYNEVIGGDKGKKVKGINQLVNEYKQKTGEKLPRLKQLDKQIGSAKEKFIIAIETDEELQDELGSLVEVVTEKVSLLDRSVKNLFKDTTELGGVYFRKEAINTISRRWFASYEKFETALAEELAVKYNKEKEEYKLPDFINWRALKMAIEKLASVDEPIWKNYYTDVIEGLDNKSAWGQFLAVFEYEYNQAKNGRKDKGDKTLAECTADIKTILEKNQSEKLRRETEIIKNYCDRILGIQRFAKYFSLEKKRQWNEDNLKTDDFYVDYLQYHADSFEGLVKPYDRIRNYLTKKPFNTDKWVLNFENPDLASGWDKNKESANTAVILRKDGRYYLGVMDIANRKLFANIQEDGSGYEKMVYKYTKDVVTTIPKCSTQMKDVVEHFKNSKEDYVLSSSGVGNFTVPLIITKEIFDLNNKVYSKSDITKSLYRWEIPSTESESDYIKSFQKDYLRLGGSRTVYQESVKKWLDFCKSFLESYPSSAFFDYSNLKDTREYRSIDEAYSDMNSSGYKIYFENIPNGFIEDANKNNKLYLFEIHNKDWNLKVKDGSNKDGKKNIHTLYFEQVFSEANQLNNFVVKLNGEAELFFRPATDVKDLGERLVKGKRVIMHPRYAEDKMFFHVPITFNRTAPDVFGYNKNINEQLANNPNINIIGIDRGEKHLAYLSVINQKGEILEIESLNKIKVKNKEGVVTDEIDYAQKLEDRAKEREAARRDWKSVEQIKDLKKGYISHVVRRIADLIIKYNAVVVFEDLNMRFKQVRGGIEKSVYQQLEKALIDKLNFLVDKGEMDADKAGHVLHAYQLTAPFESFQKMGKQTGVLFYTQAEYTSQTDPVTGFRKNLYLSNSSTIEKVQNFIKNFDKIGWDSEKQSYFFEYNPINFVDKKYKDQTVDKTWRVYADVPRIKRENKKGYWETVAVNPNEEFKKLFDLWLFDQQEAEDMKDQIFQMMEDGRLDGTKEFDGRSRNFWQSFIYLFNLISQLRNSTATQFKKDDEGNVVKTIAGVDFISSPVEPFFCTDGGKFTEGYVNMAGMEELFIGGPEKLSNFKKEFNGDANGAYNIARKGKIILDRISKDFEKPDLFISKKDWDKFTQKGEGEAIAKVIKGEKELVEGKGVRGDLTVLAKKHK